MQCDWAQVSGKHFCRALHSGWSTLPASCFRLPLLHTHTALSLGRGSEAGDRPSRSCPQPWNHSVSDPLVHSLLSMRGSFSWCVCHFLAASLPLPCLDLLFCSLLRRDWAILHSLYLPLDFKAAHISSPYFLPLTALNVDSSIHSLQPGRMVLGSYKLH